MVPSSLLCPEQAWLGPLEAKGGVLLCGSGALEVCRLRRPKGGFVGLREMQRSLGGA